MEVGYKPKTIEKIIQNKINHWVKSIDSEELRNKILNDYIVTGGAITSMLLGENPNDFDVYFHTAEIAKEVADYYIAKVLEKQKSNTKIAEISAEVIGESVRVFVKSSGILSDDLYNQNYDYFEQTTSSVMDKFLKGNKSEKHPYSVALITDNAISLYDDIQIILRFTGNPETIHCNFDYVHTTNYYTPKTGLVLNLNAVTATMSKTLTYVGSLYPICTLFRMRKFLNRGWSITGGEILKIAWDISKLDLNNIDVLREQLTGVDLNYFIQIINFLSKEKPNGDYDRFYLISLIDRVFDGNNEEQNQIEDMFKE